jgi:hypothetical protein
MDSLVSGETPATERQGFWKLETALEARSRVADGFGVAAARYVTAWRPIDAAAARRTSAKPLAIDPNSWTTSDVDSTKETESHAVAKPHSFDRGFHNGSSIIC